MNWKWNKQLNLVIRRKFIWLFGGFLFGHLARIWFGSWPKSDWSFGGFWYCPHFIKTTNGIKRREREERISIWVSISCKIPCKRVQGLSLKNGLSLRKQTASGPGRIKNTYHHMTKSSTTPIVMLTLQDLRDVIREEMGSSVNVTHESETPSASQHVPAKLAGRK